MTNKEQIEKEYVEKELGTLLERTLQLENELHLSIIKD